jgi:hypothetical protein
MIGQLVVQPNFEFNLLSSRSGKGGQSVEREGIICPVLLYIDLGLYILVQRVSAVHQQALQATLTSAIDGIITYVLTLPVVACLSA